MRRFFICLFLILFALSCLSQATNQNKFISLSPSITEIFFDIEAQDSLVGVISPNNYPLEASNKEVVATYGFVNYEKIFALNPSECLTIEGMQSSEELQRLRNVNIKVVEYKIENLEDLYAIVLDIGAKTNRKETAAERVLKIKREIDDISKNSGFLRAIFVVGLDPVVAVGKGSFLNDVLKKCGIENVFGNQIPSYFTPSFEMIVEKNPQTIILPKGEINKNSIESFLSKLKKFLPSLKTIEVEADLLMRPSLRIVEGMKQIKSQTTKDKK